MHASILSISILPTSISFNSHLYLTISFILPPPNFSSIQTVTEIAENIEDKNRIMKITRHTNLCGLIDVTYVHEQKNKFLILQTKLLQVHDS